jgi:hypothetical protein
MNQLIANKISKKMSKSFGQTDKNEIKHTCAQKLHQKSVVKKQ